MKIRKILNQKSSINALFVLLGAPDALSFEHFLPWISKIMLAYEVDYVPENDPLAPKEHSFSTGYYTKKVSQKVKLIFINLSVCYTEVVWMKKHA